MKVTESATMHCIFCNADRAYCDLSQQKRPDVAFDKIVIFLLTDRASYSAKYCSIVNWMQHCNFMATNKY